VQSLASTLSPEEIAQRRDALAALKVHPRDQAENIALIARGNRLYQQLLGESRTTVGHLLLQFQHLVEAQDPLLLTRARAEFAAALDALEQGPQW
jgi:molecular chaperone HscC